MTSKQIRNRKFLQSCEKKCKLENETEEYAQNLNIQPSAQQKLDKIGFFIFLNM